MKPLTRDDIEKLTPEQQETLASIGLHSLQARQRLLAQAHSYFGRKSLSFSWLIIVLYLWANIPGLPAGSKTPISIVAVAILVLWHAAGINRRLDAVLKLLDSDIKKLAPTAPDIAER